MPSLWTCLEALPGLTAAPAVWRARTSEQFYSFKRLCLQTGQIRIRHLPCPHSFGCAYTVLTNPDDTILGTCRCDPRVCPDVLLTLADITSLDVSWPRLARALARAFDLDVKSANFPLPQTAQIGSWSADAVPVILTIQYDRFVFRRVIAELGLRLNRPYILFAPTSTLMDANCQELLADARAAFFPLDSNVLLTDHGTLHPKTPPGELFAKFTPQPKEMDEDLASRVVALVSQFDSETLTVFRLYCIQALSAAQIARKCSCSKAAVVRKLIKIRTKTGTDPQHLRRLSPHLAKIEVAATDPRAARIHRKRLILDADDSSDSEF